MIIINNENRYVWNRYELLGLYISTYIWTSLPSGEASEQHKLILWSSSCRLCLYQMPSQIIHRVHIIHLPVSNNNLQQQIATETAEIPSLIEQKNLKIHIYLWFWALSPNTMRVLAKFTVNGLKPDVLDYCVNFKWLCSLYEMLSITSVLVQLAKIEVWD